MNLKDQKATFTLTILKTENASWQGTLKWLEKNEEVPFRSALEMIKLIDGVVEKSQQ